MAVTAEQLAALYLAYFGRPPNADGVVTVAAPSPGALPGALVIMGGPIPPNVRASLTLKEAPADRIPGKRPRPTAMSPAKRLIEQQRQRRAKS